MEKSKVVIVHLRQPDNRPDEKRSDPFWEFGSFGCTGCHSTNLMNPKNANQLDGKRLAFAQNGGQGFKLVFLSPPISITNYENLIEAKWTPECMPFKYTSAPLIIDKYGNTDIPSIKDKIKDVNRTTWVSKFSSKFRSRKRPVCYRIAYEIIEVYDRFLSKGNNVLAKNYVEALPYCPPLPDTTRHKTYRYIIDMLHERINYNNINQVKACSQNDEKLLNDLKLIDHCKKPIKPRC
jgi:hypothetical protein